MTDMKRRSTESSGWRGNPTLDEPLDSWLDPADASILVVDDIPANLLAFEVILEPLGYRLVKARSGTEALRHLLVEDFAVILMDVHMPELDGFETVRLIKQSPRHRCIPILFVTANCRDNASIAKGYETGAVDYILKPVDPDILRSKVAVLVELSQQRELSRVQAEIVRRHERDAIERRSERRFRSLIDAMPLLVWAADAEGRLHYANQAWARYSGAPRRRYIEVTLFENLHPDDRERVSEAWEAALEDPRAVEVQARFRRARDGAYRWHLTRAVPQRDERGRVQEWIITATDIEDQKRVEQEEHEARRAAESTNRSAMTDEFLATLSHELRTPLAAIVGWTNILRSGKLGSPGVDRALETIARNAQAETQLVQDILDVSRIVTGKLVLQMVPVDPAPVVLTALDDLRPHAAAKGVALVGDVAPSDGWLMGDPDRLRQIVWKLAANAVKFTPSGGRVDVRFARVGARFELVVTDTGEGIAPEFLPHLFERFSQADRSLTRRHGGLGLGLSILRELVELHGGNARVESAGPGRGATFTVELPASTRAIDARERAAFGRRALEGLRVLLVGGDAADRAAMIEILEGRGAIVVPAPSGDEAATLARFVKPDVVIGAWQPSDAAGPSLIQKMSALEGVEPTPIVAVIDAAGADDAKQALAAGVQSYIARPIHPAHLVAAVAGYKRRRAHPGSFGAAMAES